MPEHVRLGIGNIRFGAIKFLQQKALKDSTGFFESPWCPMSWDDRPDLWFVPSIPTFPRPRTICYTFYVLSFVYRFWGCCLSLLPLFEKTCGILGSSGQWPHGQQVRLTLAACGICIIHWIQQTSANQIRCDRCTYFVLTVAIIGVRRYGAWPMIICYI